MGFSTGLQSTTRFDRCHLAMSSSYLPPLHSLARAGVGAAPVDGDDAALAASESLEGKEEGLDIDVPVVSRAQRDMAVVILEKLSHSLPTSSTRIDLVSCEHCKSFDFFVCFFVLFFCFWERGGFFFCTYAKQCVCVVM